MLGRTPLPSEHRICASVVALRKDKATHPAALLFFRCSSAVLYTVDLESGQLFLGVGLACDFL